MSFFDGFKFVLSVVRITSKCPVGTGMYMVSHDSEKENEESLTRRWRSKSESNLLQKSPPQFISHSKHKSKTLKLRMIKELARFT